MTHPTGTGAHEFTDYLRLFVAEGRERLAEMLVELEADGPREQAVGVCRRAAHQIAGSSAMMGCRGIAAFARAMERFVRRVEVKELPFGTAQRGWLRLAASALRAALERAGAGDRETVPTPALRVLLEAWAPAPHDGPEETRGLADPDRR